MCVKCIFICYKNTLSTSHITSAVVLTYSTPETHSMKDRFSMDGERNGSWWFLDWFLCVHTCNSSSTTIMLVPSQLKQKWSAWEQGGRESPAWRRGEACWQRMGRVLCTVQPVARFLTGHGLAPVRGPGIGDLCFSGK